MGSYVAAALGTAVLEPALGEAGAAILGRLAATAFPMAAGVALVMETLNQAPPDLIVAAVLLLFGAEALLGAATRASRLVPAWVGVDSNSLERCLAGGPADRLARRLLLPGPARHPAAVDQHPAHPIGGRTDRSVRASVTAAARGSFEGGALLE
jgi:hypothetical protein